MAKTKRIEVWGVFDKDKKLGRVEGYDFIKAYMVGDTKEDVDMWCRPGDGETVRPVTISWEVDK